MPDFSDCCMTSKEEKEFSSMCKAEKAGAKITTTNQTTIEMESGFNELSS